ncbi:MAG: Mut7-C RNAse domain-containing protein [Nitrospirota bacterium]|jgi:uncharacterized protein with PIN domain
MATIYLRLYEELNDYLPEERSKRTFAYEVAEGASLGEVVDGLGVPRGEVDLALVDGEAVGFDHRVRDGERIALYPVFESLDVGSVTALPGRPLRESRFALDVHLGRLARYLRLLGFDAAYHRDCDDDELVAIARSEGRILLSRDGPLVARRDVSHAYLVASQVPGEQAVEVVRRCDLAGQVRPFSRCLVCNGEVATVAVAEVVEPLPEWVRATHREVRRCTGCGRVYWRGGHWQRMQRLVKAILRAAEA